MKGKILLLGLVLVGAIIFSCAPKATPAADVRPVEVAAPAAKGGWEAKWEKLVTEAKSEGVISFYSTAWEPKARILVTGAFRDKYGITVEFMPFARGAEMAARVQTEKVAGLYVADVFGTGGPTALTILKPAGLLKPIEPLLILPEALDRNSWAEKAIPYYDKEKYSMGMIGAAKSHLFYNTNLVKKGELTSYKDVLKPEYKGKITLNDPTVTGSGNHLVSTLAHHMWNVEETREFLRQLLKQDVSIQRDNRLHVESVARGKYAIGLAPNTSSFAEFINLGAPIDGALVKEGTNFVVGAGALAVPAIMAHPNAATVFINWLLTKEGQTLLVRGFGNASLRQDVPPENVPPYFLPQPGQKLHYDSEEFILFQGEMIKIAKEIIVAK